MSKSVSFAIGALAASFVLPAFAAEGEAEWPREGEATPATITEAGVEDPVPPGPPAVETETTTQQEQPRGYAEVEQRDPQQPPEREPATDEPSAESAAEPAPTELPTKGDRRDSWYIGFGFGSGWASTSFGGESLNWSDMPAFDGADSTRVSLEFELGGTLSSQLLLGARIVGIREEFDEGGVSFALQHTNYLANLTYFPLESGEGLFLRVGIGLATISEELDSALASGSNSETGFAAGVGLGYALWLGETFNLTLSNDFNVAAFGGDEEAGEPTSGWFDVIHLGFYWY